MNGKEKCKLLKQFRAQIAAEHGIEGFEYKECESVGNCTGTCQVCDAEARALESALRDKNVYIRVPSDTSMPVSLIKEMEYSVYKDMQELCHPWLMDRCDYEKTEAGRIVTRNPEKEQAIVRKAQREILKDRNQRIRGGLMMPRTTDFNELEQNIIDQEKEMARKTKFDNIHIDKIRGLLKKKDGDN